MNHTDPAPDRLSRLVRDRLHSREADWLRLRVHIRNAANYPLSEARELSDLIKTPPLYPRAARKSLKALRRAYREAYRDRSKTEFEAFKAKFTAATAEWEASARIHVRRLAQQKTALMPVRDAFRRIAALLLDIRRRLRQGLQL